MTSSGDADVLDRTSVFGDPSFADLSTITSGGTTPHNQNQGALAVNQNGSHYVPAGYHGSEVGPTYPSGKGSSRQSTLALERSRSHDEIVHELSNIKRSRG